MGVACCNVRASIARKDRRVWLKRFKWPWQATGPGSPTGVQSPPLEKARYNAFVSYSHAADDKLAPVVQHALHTFAKPWYQLRAMHVFRDKTNLAASPGLWQSIETALGDSQWFLFMASPRAAQSHWVGQEITWWLRNRGSARMLILVTEGDLV